MISRGNVSYETMMELTGQTREELERDMVEARKAEDPLDLKGVVALTPPAVHELIANPVEGESYYLWLVASVTVEEDDPQAPPPMRMLPVVIATAVSRELAQHHANKNRLAQRLAAAKDAVDVARATKTPKKTMQSLERAEALAVCAVDNQATRATLIFNKIYGSEAKPRWINENTQRMPDGSRCVAEGKIVRGFVFMHLNLTTCQLELVEGKPRRLQCYKVDHKGSGSAVNASEDIGALKLLHMLYSDCVEDDIGDDCSVEENPFAIEDVAPSDALVAATPFADAPGVASAPGSPDGETSGASQPDCEEHVIAPSILGTAAALGAECWETVFEGKAAAEYSMKVPGEKQSEIMLHTTPKFDRTVLPDAGAVAGMKIQLHAPQRSWQMWYPGLYYYNTII